MTQRRILLINPRITSNARFPLAVMQLATALKPQYLTRIIDGNLDRDFVAAAVAAQREEGFDAVGISVMGGPQLPAAIAVSKALRAVAPGMPIIWGGYFPTICPDATLDSTFVDYALRGQGEGALLELLTVLFSGALPESLSAVEGLSWRRGDEHVHNRDRSFTKEGLQLSIDYDSVDQPGRYLSASYLGRRTTGYQAALGCRYRCTFCGVAAMFKGKTALPTAERLEQELGFLKTRFGADSVQFYDHNFFDREVDMVPLLEVLARLEMPWWCYARADALLNLSESSWKLVRKSRLRMAYIGAESASPTMLKEIRKGTRPDQTLAVAELCRRHGVIPELSFMVAPPENSEEETEHTFEFIRELKRVNPQSEIIVYVYTPLPESSKHEKDRGKRASTPLLDLNGNPLVFPSTPEEWTQKQWVDYACHADAPWVSDKLRQRIHDFVTVLRCRYPTVQDLRSPTWAKRTLSAAASWRYRMRRYDRPWELNLANRLVRLRMPQVSGL